MNATQIIAAALAALRAERGEVPAGRSDVTVDGQMVRVYGITPGIRTLITVQFIKDSTGYTANVNASGKIGKVSNYTR